MAVLGLRFCARAFSSCGKRGPLFIAVRGPLTIAASRCGAQAPVAQAQQLWLTGLVAPRHVGSSQTRAWTHVPCIGRQILNHCATREAHKHMFKWYHGRTSLVAQCLRIRLPMQGTQAWSLVREDPTCCRATKPVGHNYWDCALEPVSHNYWARASRAHSLQQEKPLQWEAHAPQPRVAHNRRN